MGALGRGPWRRGISGGDLHAVDEILGRAEARPFHPLLVVHPAFRREHLAPVLCDRFCHLLITCANSAK